MGAALTIPSPLVTLRDRRIHPQMDTMPSQCMAKITEAQAGTFWTGTEAKCGGRLGRTRLLETVTATSSVTSVTGLCSTDRALLCLVDCGLLSGIAQSVPAYSPPVHDPDLAVSPSRERGSGSHVESNTCRDIDSKG
jgi:hypothetical protein